VTRLRRSIAVLILAAVAVPAVAYVLPVPAILRRLAGRRAAQALATIEVTGTLQASGAAAEGILAAGGIRGAGGFAALPARLLWKVPGRCRIELAPAGVVDADRPYLLVRDDAVTGDGDVSRNPSFVAMARATCALLAVAPSAEAADQPWAAALAKRGVALGDATLGRFDGRVSYVIGGRPTDAKPLAWVDKESFQPVRLLFMEAGTMADVRFLGWGSPTGGDWAPRAIEVHAAGALQLRFTTEKASANPKLADLLFQ
jgi:hypothetical protein